MTITVHSTKRDAKTRFIENHAEALHSTRPVRDTRPILENLCELGAWLVRNVPKSVEGRMPHPQKQYRVIVQNGRTEGEQILHEAQTLRRGGDGRIYKTTKLAINSARSVLKCYHGYMDRPQQIDDWLFSQIQPNQTDEEYWNKEAAKMIAAGGRTVIIGKSVFRMQA